MKDLIRRLIPYLTTLAVTILLLGLLPVSDTLWARVLTFSGSVETREQNAEGCTLGFWKQEKHFRYWPEAYDPGDSFEAIFQRDVPSTPTLLEALELGNGGLDALMRQATAALLNAASQEIKFPYGADQVIEMFQGAYDSGDPEPTKEAFDAANNGDCPLPPPQTTAELGAEVTAEGSYEEELTYDWTVAVTVDPSSLELEPGQGESLIAYLVGTRAQVSAVDRFSVQGEVCVTNEGEGATQDLSIEAVLQARLGDGDFTDLASTPVDLSSKPVLAAGERQCYAYQVAFVPEEGADYRVIARVAAANEAEPAEAGPGPQPAAAIFILPATPSLAEVDREADLSGSLECPDGFECIIPGETGWHLTESGEVEFAFEIVNVSATCEARPLRIDAALAETGSGEAQIAAASVVLNTAGCEAIEGSSPGPKPTASPTSENTATSVASETPTPAHSDTPEPTLIPSATALASEEPTSTPSP